MNEDWRDNTSLASRRRLLQTVGGVGLAATFGSGTAVAQEIDNGDTDPLDEEPIVYVGNQDDSVYAVDAVSGEQQWETDLNLGPNNVYAPTAVDGRLYIGHNSSGRDPSYYALDTESGSVEWEFDPDEDDRMTPPTIVEGIMYVGTDPSEGNVARLYALDAATGDIEWEYTDANRIRVAPTVVDNTVYIGARQGEVEWGITALDASTGEVEWQFTDATLGSIRAAPLIYKDKIFLTRNAVIALDRTTGEQEWETEFDGAFDNTIPPVATDGSLYIGADETLHSLNTSSGNVEWSHEVGEPIESGAAVHNETVVVVSYDIDDRTGTLHAVDAQTEEELWTYSGLTEYDFRPQLPTIYDNTVYVTDTRLHAVDIETGEQEWIFDREIDFPRDLRSPTVVDTTEEGTSRDSRVQHGVLGHNDFEAELTVQPLTIADVGPDDSFSVAVTIEETAGIAIENLEITLTVTPDDADTTSYNETLTVSDLNAATERTVTFGEDEDTPEVGPLAEGDYETTVEIVAANAETARTSASFGVSEQPTAEDFITRDDEGNVEDVEVFDAIDDFRGDRLEPDELFDVIDAFREA